MHKRSRTKVAFVVGIAALGTSVLAFAADWRGGPAVYGLFPRSGALIALSGAVLEYQVSIGTYLRNVYKPGTAIDMRSLAQAFNESDRERRMRVVAHSLVTMRTIVWAFGDLVFRWL